MDHNQERKKFSSLQCPSSSTEVEIKGGGKKNPKTKPKKTQDFDIHFLSSLCLSSFLNQGFGKQFKLKKCDLSSLRCPLSPGIWNTYRNIPKSPCRLTSGKMLGVMIKQNEKNNSFVREFSADNKATYQRNQIAVQNLKTSNWEIEYKQRMCALTK